MKIISLQQRIPIDELIRISSTKHTSPVPTILRPFNSNVKTSGEQLNKTFKSFPKSFHCLDMLHNLSSALGIFKFT